MSVSSAWGARRSVGPRTHARPMWSECPDRWMILWSVCMCVCIYIYIYIYTLLFSLLFIIITIISLCYFTCCPPEGARPVFKSSWSRTNGVNPNRVAAKEIVFDRLGEKASAVIIVCQILTDWYPKQVPLSKTQNLQ